MPFGLCNALATFQRLINFTFTCIFNEFVLVYLDNILVYSKSQQEYLMHLLKVFKKRRISKLLFRLKIILNLEGSTLSIWVTKLYMDSWGGPF